MNKYVTYLLLASLPLLLAMALPAQQEAVGFSPPGWVGGALAVLALILPVVVWLWLRREQD